MSHFEKPDYVTDDGVKINVEVTSHIPTSGWSDPVGHHRLQIQTRAKMGSETNSSIPISAALLILSKATEIKAMIEKAVKDSEAAAALAAENADKIEEI